MDDREALYLLKIENSRLRAALDVAERALEPFVLCAKCLPYDSDDKWTFGQAGQRAVIVGDLRRAGAALDEIRKAKGE